MRDSSGRFGNLELYLIESCSENTDIATDELRYTGHQQLYSRGVAFIWYICSLYGRRTFSDWMELNFSVVGVRDVHRTRFFILSFRFLLEIIRTRIGTTMKTHGHVSLCVMYCVINNLYTVCDRWSDRGPCPLNRHYIDDLIVIC